MEHVNQEKPVFFFHCCCFVFYQNGLNLLLFVCDDLQCRKRKSCRFNPWIRKIPWRRAWQSTTIFLPGESHGQRNLVGYTVHGVAKELNSLATKWNKTKYSLLMTLSAFGMEASISACDCVCVLFILISLHTLSMCEVWRVHREGGWCLWCQNNLQNSGLSQTREKSGMSRKDSPVVSVAVFLHWAHLLPGWLFFLGSSLSFPRRCPGSRSLSRVELSAAPSGSSQPSC